MDKLLKQLILEFKKIKRVRGNLFENFLSFVHSFLLGEKDDKYNMKKKEIMRYIIANQEAIKIELIKN